MAQSFPSLNKKSPSPDTPPEKGEFSTSHFTFTNCIRFATNIFFNSMKTACLQGLSKSEYQAFFLDRLILV